NAATLTAQPYSGTTAIGTAINDGSPPTALTLESTTYTNTSGAVTWTDLSDTNFTVKLTAATTNNGFTESIDYVRVTVNYMTTASSTMELGGFNIGVPTTASNVSLSVRASWDVSTASTGT